MIEDFSPNIDIFYFLFSFSRQSVFWDNFFVFISLHLIFVLIFFYIIFFTFKIWEDKKIEWWEPVLYFAGVCGAWLVTKVIKALLPTDRPFVFLQDVNSLVVETELTSFPSGHSAVSFALATSLFLHNKKVGFVALFVAILVALGRVFTGVHFPLDILVGGLLGAGVSWGMWKRMKKYQ